MTELNAHTVLELNGMFEIPDMKWQEKGVLAFAIFNDGITYEDVKTVGALGYDGAKGLIHKLVSKGYLKQVSPQRSTTGSYQVQVYKYAGNTE